MDKPPLIGLPLAAQMLLSDSTISARAAVHAGAGPAATPTQIVATSPVSASTGEVENAIVTPSEPTASPFQDAAR